MAKAWKNEAAADGESEGLGSQAPGKGGPKRLVALISNEVKAAATG